MKSISIFRNHSLLDVIEKRKIRALARCHVTLRDIKLKMNENRETKTILLQAYIFFNLLVKTYLVIGLCCW